MFIFEKTISIENKITVSLIDMFGFAALGTDGYGALVCADGTPNRQY